MNLLAYGIDQYHEDMGPVTWWKLPVEEPAWIGTPNDSDWPGYHTHFTPHPPEPDDRTEQLIDGSVRTTPHHRLNLSPEEQEQFKKWLANNKEEGK